MDLQFACNVWHSTMVMVSESLRHCYFTEEFNGGQIKDEARTPAGIRVSFDASILLVERQKEHLAH